MLGEGNRETRGVRIKTSIPSKGMLNLKSVLDPAGIKQGDVLHVKIDYGEGEEDCFARVRSRGRLSIPKSQLKETARDKIIGKHVDLRMTQIHPAEPTDLSDKGKINLQEVVSRIGGYVIPTKEGMKIGLEDGRGEIRTLEPRSMQMDMKQFFENVGRNFADSEGAQGLKNMDPKMIQEYTEYLKEMGLTDLSNRFQIASNHALSDEVIQEYLRQRLKLNPEMSENTRVSNSVYPPVDNPTRNPIGTASVEKRSVPLSQIHEEALKIVREAINGLFHPDICRQICQDFIRGAWGGDGGITSQGRGNLRIMYSEQDPFKQKLIRDSIETGHSVSLRPASDPRDIINVNQEDIKKLAKEGIGGANAIRGGRLLGELIIRTTGREHKQFEKLLKELAPWLNEYINVVREIERLIPGSLVNKWKEYIQLLVDTLPPDDISFESHQSPPGS